MEMDIAEPLQGWAAIGLPAKRSRRRSSIRYAVALLIAALVLLIGALPAGAAPPANDVGPDRVYFPATGHYLAYGFLDYWHHYGDLRIFGYPISEEFTDPATGLTVQYFERAVFEWHPDATRAWRVQLRRLGADLSIARQDQAPFKPVTAASDANCSYFPQTSHRLCFGFRAFWNANGGLAFFGYPISEEFTENGYTVQYFERARFEWHPELAGTPYVVQLGLLGDDAARINGVATAPLPPSSTVAAYEPDLWYVPEPAGPREVRTPPPGAPDNQAKWIEVDLANQYLRAWEYDNLAYGSYISTGIAAYPTPTGTFSVIGKLPIDDLTGGLAGSQATYSNVPYVMYFYDGYAIHGAYWHDNFGTPMSHGTVQLPLDAAHWLYDWTPYGTIVWIHQ